MSYYINSTGTTSHTFDSNSYIQVVGTGQYSGSNISFEVEKNKGISPVLYFKYVKRNVKLLDRRKLDRRLESIENAFYAACENGQEALGEKLMSEMAVATRETEIILKGVTKYVERAVALKYKKRLNSGHISDTMLKDFTRVIPKNVLKKKKEVESVFDDFVIFHYWNEKSNDAKAMTADERSKMRDPILFGIIKECDRLYFIADWEDEYCDLTFDRMIEVIGRDHVGVIKSKINRDSFIK